MISNTPEDVITEVNEKLERLEELESILNWLEENTRCDYPEDGWAQEMGWDYFDTLEDWIKHHMKKSEN